MAEDGHGLTMRSSEVEGFATATIAGGDGELEATFVPGAGMLCCSLCRRGTELLDRRHGVRAYATRGKTMGIPLLYPWANRLADFTYPGSCGEVVLRPEDPLLTRDPNGLPIHGALPGRLPWELLDADGEGAAEADDAEADAADDVNAEDALRARLSWDREDLLAIFPWRHEVEMHARIAGATLTIETTVHASVDDPAGEVALPVSFGFHPYVAPGEGERGDWVVQLPVSERLVLNGQMIPTGASEPFESREFALEGSDWDDAFAGLATPPVFSLTAGHTRIELELLRGYSYAQFYAPAGERFACFEPMTAPANALRSGAGLHRLAPGTSYEAAFSIRTPN